MNERRRAAIALGLLALIAACKPTVGGDGGGTSPEEACATVANAFCKQGFNLACGLDAYYPSVEACAQREAEVCVEALDLPGAAFDVDAELRCAAAIPAFDCEELFSPTPACPQQLGTHKPGEPCVEGLQCTTGVCSGTTSWCGQCMSLATEGEPCENSFSGHDGGTVCAGELLCVGSPLRCMKPGVLGASCSASEPCGAFFACNHGVCSKLEAGAPCDPNDDNCDWGKELFCDSSSKTCKKPKAPAPPLSGCVVSTNLCAADEYCDETPPTPVCKKETPEGGVCDFAHPLCIWPSWCDHGRCSSTPTTCE